METLYSLEEIKDIIGVDYSDDDSLIQQIVTSTQIYIDSCCGTAYKENERHVELAKLVFTQICTDLYEERRVTIDKNTRNVFYTTIFSILAGDENA